MQYTRVVCCILLVVWYSSSSRMHFMSLNWSATKQRLHPQSVAEISRHSVLSGDGILQISVCKSLFSSAGTEVSLFRVKTVQQRLLLSREIETRLPVVASHTRWKLNIARLSHFTLGSKKNLIDRSVFHRSFWTRKLTMQLSRHPFMPPSNFDVNCLQI